MQNSKFIGFVFGCAICAMLNGCVSAPEASTQNQLLVRASAPPPGKATVYLMRPGGFVGSVVPVEVKIDNDIVGRLGLKTYVYAFAEPGQHEIHTAMYRPDGSKDSEASQSFNIDAGSVLYMIGKFEGDNRGYVFKFKPIAEPEGLKLINAYKLTDNETIKSQ